MEKIIDIEKRARFCAVAPQYRISKGEEPEQISGTAIVFGRESLELYRDEQLVIREVIAPEAVTRELLDSCCILMTLYHNNERVLARSLQGKGTLEYDVDESGVHFKFTPPDTEDGRTARELVKRGDISGCSFAFRARYSDKKCVERSSETVDGVEIVTYTVRKIESIHDFTLTPTPAYPDTEVSSRMATLDKEIRSSEESAQEQKSAKWLAEAARLRRIANRF